MPRTWASEVPEAQRAVVVGQRCQVRQHLLRFRIFQDVIHLGRRIAQAIGNLRQVLHDGVDRWIDLRVVKDGVDALVRAAHFIDQRDRLVLQLFRVQLGDHVIVNRGALIGHHTRIGDYVSIMPGANIAGKRKT